jgi:GNAT superfamily N-acetyltransferase
MERSGLQDLVVTSDYMPGALARLIEMHAHYYAREWGFGPFFEARVAAEAAAFLAALPRDDSRIWFARKSGRVVGSIAIDGRAAAEAGAHLRWFIVDDSLRGTGAGAALIDAALAFCRDRNFPSVYLWTFAGLDAARRLYEARGFRLVEDVEAQTWGLRMREQRFELTMASA